MQELKIVKKQLVLDLDKNEAPTAWRWRVDRFVRFDDGSEHIIAAEIPATVDEVRDHVGAAVLKQAADIENDRKVRDGIAAERDQAIRLLSESEGKLAQVAEADAAYDKRVRPLFAKPEAQETVQ